MSTQKALYLVEAKGGKLVTERISDDPYEHEDALLQQYDSRRSQRSSGIAQSHEGKLDLTLESPEMKRMRARCNRFVPGLEHAELDLHSPIVQGLRPARGENVRVERELRRKADGSVSKIVHSYGQGGSGFTLSFGCAGDVLSLVEEAAAGIATTPIQSERVVGAYV